MDAKQTGDFLLKKTPTLSTSLSAGRFNIQHSKLKELDAEMPLVFFLSVLLSKGGGPLAVEDLHFHNSREESDRFHLDN
ncbi:MAG: hypothetical protein WC875_01465 [Candidatus Absconditabacterales bacterium]